MTNPVNVELQRRIYTLFVGVRAVVYRSKSILTDPRVVYMSGPPNPLISQIHAVERINAHHNYTELRDKLEAVLRQWDYTGDGTANLKGVFTDAEKTLGPIKRLQDKLPR